MQQRRYYPNGRKQSRVTGRISLSKNPAPGDSLRSNTPSTNVAVTEGHGEFPVAKVKDTFIS